MTTRTRRTACSRGRRSAPSRLIDYSKQRADTGNTAILCKTKRCSSTGPLRKVVPSPPCQTNASTPDRSSVLVIPNPYRTTGTSYATPALPRDDDDLPSSIGNLEKMLQPLQQTPACLPLGRAHTMHTLGSRRWELDEALLDVSVKTFEDDDDDSESDSVSESDTRSGSCSDEADTKSKSTLGSSALVDTSGDTLGTSEASSDHDESSSENDESSSEISDSSSDDEEEEDGDEEDVPDDISELSDDESMRAFECFEEPKDDKDLKGESTMIRSTGSDTFTASLTESNHESRSVESVCFSIRRRKPPSDESLVQKEVIPSAIRLQRSITRLLGDGSNESGISQDTRFAPDVNPEGTGHTRRPSLTCSVGNLLADPKLVSRRSVLRRSNSYNGSSLIPAAPKKNAAPTRIPSKRNLLTPLINALAQSCLPEKPTKRTDDERKVNRRALARSSSESKMIVLNHDGTVQRRGVAKTKSSTSLGALMNDASARILIEKSLKASEAHARSTSVQSLVRSNSCRSLTGINSGSTTGRSVMGNNSGRRLMSNNSGRTIMSNNSGRRLMGCNSGRRSMGNDMDEGLKGGNGNEDRKARRRAQRSKSRDTNESQCMTKANESISSLGSHSKLIGGSDASVLTIKKGTASNQSSSSLGDIKNVDDASECSSVMNGRRGVATNRSCSSLGSIMKIESSSDNHMKNSTSSASMGKLVDVNDLRKLSRRRVTRRNKSTDSVGSNETEASNATTSTRKSLSSLRDCLAKSNPRPAAGPGGIYGDPSSSLFVTGSRIRRSGSIK